MLLLPAPHTCDVHVTGEPCNRCVCCNDDVCLAGNRKYDSAVVWSFAEHSPGIFTLYNEARQTYLITDDWETVLAIYRDRPAYTKPAPRPSNKASHAAKPSAKTRAENSQRLLAELFK